MTKFPQTPEQASDEQIAKLMGDEITRVFYFADTLKRVEELFCNPETVFKPKPEDKPVVNLRRAYDLHFEYQSAAPKDMRWSCIDLNTYDGAPDSHGMNTFIGRGEDRRAAMLDLLDQFGEFEGQS